MLERVHVEKLVKEIEAHAPTRCPVNRQGHIELLCFLVDRIEVGVSVAFVQHRDCREEACHQPKFSRAPQLLCRLDGFVNREEGHGPEPGALLRVAFGDPGVVGTGENAGPLGILDEPERQPTGWVKHGRMNAEFIEELEPTRGGNLRVFARNAEAAVPAIQRGEKTVGLESGHIAVTPFEKLVKLGVLLQDVAVRVNDRVIAFHFCSLLERD